MRVLIVNTNRERAPGTLVPLGACAVASAAEAAGHEVSCLDLTFPRAPLRALERRLRDFRPEVVGLSVRNLDNGDMLAPRSYLPFLRELVAVCRRESSAEVVLGGAAIGPQAGAWLRYLDLRLAVAGEGEAAFPALLAALEGHGSPERLPGVVHRDNGGVTSVAPAPHRCLEALPAPRPERWLDLRLYHNSEASWPLQTKRGCALHCAYCVYPEIEGRVWRLRSPEAVAASAEEGRRLGFRYAEIVDSVFGLPPDHALACCEALARLPRRLPLTVMELTAGAVTPELIGGLNAAACCAVGLTAESGSDRMLAALGKDYTAADLHRTAALARGLRAARMWIFLVGAPGEDAVSLRETAAFMATLPPEDLLFVTYGVRLLPGTGITAQLLASGELDPGADLLSPAFYFSPQVTPQQARAILAEAVPASRLLGLDQADHPLLPLAQRLATALHLPPPYWRHARRLRPLLRLLRR